MANAVEIVVTQTQEGSFDDIRRDVERKIVDPLNRAGQEAEQSFSRVGDRIKSEFSGVRSSIESDLGQIRPPPQMADRIAQPFEEAGEQGGAALADGITAGVDQVDFSNLGANVMNALGSLGAVGGPIGAIAAGLGVAFGDDIMAGINRSITGRRNEILDPVKTGLDPAEIGALGRAAGDAYSAGLGEALGEVRETASLLATELSTVDQSLDLGRATRQAQALAQVWEIDVAQSIGTVRRLVANDLVTDTQQGFNLIGQTAQKFRLDVEEILDVANEFSPVFGKLGVDGATAFNIIGSTVREGLLPNVDRAAELFEEFNIEMTDSAGRAKPAIDALGLSFEDLQAKIADGRGAEALAEVADALLEVGDEARRNELAVTIFGTSIESAADPQRVIELLAQADAVGEVGTAADDAAQAVEDSIGPWTALGRTVENVAAKGADLAGVFLDLSGATGDNERRTATYNDTIQTTARLLDVATTRMGVQSDRLSELGTGTERVTGLVDTLGRASDAYAGQVGNAADESNRWEQRLVDLSREMRDAAGESDTLAGSINGVEVAVGDVQAAFDAFFGISADDRLADIWEQGDRLIDSLDGVDSSAVSATGSFDLTTAAGRELHGEFSRLRDQLVGATRDFDSGKITADQYTAAQAAVESQINRVAGQAGLTAAQVSGLRSEYALVPSDVVTTLTAIDLASMSLAQISRNISLIPRNVLVTVRARRINFGGFVDQVHTGGTSSGGPAVVGDDQFGQGGELLHLQPGQQVDSAATTDAQRSFARAFGNDDGAGGVNVVVNVAGSVRSDRDLAEVIRDQIYRGGFDGLGGLR